jgi:hypothetical protein
MKKNVRLLSILLAVQLLFVSAVSGVFAEAGEIAADQDITVTEQQDELLTGETALSNVVATLNGVTATVTWQGGTPEFTVTVAVDGKADSNLTKGTNDSTITYSDLAYGGHKYVFTVTDKKGTSVVSNEIVTPDAPPITLTAYPDYKSVTLKWTAAPGAEKYVLTRSDGKTFESTSTTYRDTTYAKLSNQNQYTQYTYHVQPYVGGKAGKASAETPKVGKVRTCIYKCTFKASAKLTCHDKKKMTHTFKKGDTVQADGYGQGSYHFYYKNHLFYAKWFRMKNQKPDFDKDAYCNGFTPETYVNHGGYTSKTNYLIWVSLYSQRVYIFKGKKGKAGKGKWVLINKDGAYKSDAGAQGYLCGSGKAKSPTPAGMDKKLHRKVKKFSKHIWWNMFQSTNAIHGSNKGDAALGKPLSGGCVRVTNAQAKWIFKNVPINTRVMIF